MKTLHGIQYLRAFAATAVVLFHAAERTGQHFAIGAAGVDVFFVVSGFIMMAISDRRPLRPIAFLRDRLLRIAPSYWIVTAIMVAGAAAGFFPNLKLDPWHVLGSLIFLPVPSPNGGQLWPVLVQGWTLNYEIFFYLVFALILMLRPALRLASLCLLLVALVVAGGFLAVSDPIAEFYTQPLILEFAAGAALAKLWAHGRLPPPAAGWLLVGGAIAGFATVHLMKMEFDAWICGPLAVALVAGMLSVETAGKLRDLPIVGYVGDASYSIYLWHTLALSVVVKAGFLLELPPLLIAGAGVIGGSLMGIVAYEWVEKPLQTILKRGRSRRWRAEGRATP